MTAPASVEGAANAVALEGIARELARTNRDLERATQTLARLFERSPIARSLEQTRKRLTASHTEDAADAKTAEWFLDNYYLIRRVARQVEEELPRGFVRRLPQCAAGPSKGLLRIDALAHSLVANSLLELDPGVVQRFVDAYQDVSPLTIAELWALPTLLRACVLEHLLEFSDEREPSLALDSVTGVERAIRTLRVLEAIDWKTFFAKTSRVEAVLRKDPAQVYARMDFETCDSYRKVVESLAWATGVAEHDVADLAITLAHEGADERRSHVGYYLVCEGRRELEMRLRYRAVGAERVRRAVTRWPMFSYLAPLALLTSGPLLAAAVYLARAGASPFAIAVAVIVGAVPASVVAVAVVQWVLARLLHPRTLPKLDFTKGLPGEARTLVVTPTLLGRAQDVEAMTRQLELHYLSNPDPELRFALLTDDADAKAMPVGAPLLESAARGIAALNAKHGKDGIGPFHLLHREPRWNPSEQRFMGWERKRGKLEELNRLLRGDAQTSFSRHVGQPEGLRGDQVRHHARQRHAASDGERASLGGAARASVEPRSVRRADRARHRRLHDRSTSHRDVAVVLAADAFLADLRGRRRLRHLHPRGLRALSRLVRRRNLRRQRHLRRRCVHAKRRGARPGERARESRSVRGSPRADRARVRHRPLRGIPEQLRRPREAHAPLGARRLAAASVVASARAVGGRRAPPQRALRRRPLEDRRQPQANADEPAAPRAPRARLDVAPHETAVLDAGRPRGPARAALGDARPRSASAPREPRAVRARDRVPRVRGGGRRRRHRSRVRAQGDHPAASAPVDERRRHGLRSREEVGPCGLLANDGSIADPRDGHRRARRVGSAVRPRRLRTAARGVVLRPRDRALGEPSVSCSRRAAAAGRASKPAAARAQDVALLRRVRGTERPVVAHRQPPGGPSRADRPSHVADQHRIDARLDAVRLRFRLPRPERALLARATSVRQHHAPPALPRAPPQLVRHEEPPAALAAVRLDGGQRELRGLLARAEARVSRRGERTRPSPASVGRSRRLRRISWRKR